MIYLHLGMPKTGSTALQVFLQKHYRRLRRGGLQYARTGRSRGGVTGNSKISHNSIAFTLNRGTAFDPEFCSAMGEELRNAADDDFVISSELLFGADLQRLKSAFLDNCGHEIRYVAFVRRLDESIASNIKQKVKTGRFRGSLEAKIDEIKKRAKDDPLEFDLGHVIERTLESFPEARFIPRLYLRDEMVGNNTISDFFHVCERSAALEGLEIEQVVNRSPSLLACRAVVDVATERNFTPFLRRQLLKSVTRSNEPLVFASNDVLSMDDRRFFTELFEARNEGLRKSYFPDRGRLFPEPDELGTTDAFIKDDQNTAQHKDAVYEFVNLHADRVLDQQ